MSSVTIGDTQISSESYSAGSDGTGPVQGQRRDDGGARDTIDANTPTTSQPVRALAPSRWLGDYVLADEEFETLTTVAVSDNTRTITTNALPNHETGKFPNAGNPNTISAQDNEWVFPINATWTGAASWVRTPGVAVNGVKFEPETAETVECASGERYRVEALQDTYDLGFDFNNAHVQPDGEYHYHGVSQLLAGVATSGSDLVHVGFAADGYLIYYSMSGAYSPSWTLSTDSRTGSGCVGSRAIGGLQVEVDGTLPDGTFISDWVFDAVHGDLDECNGTWIGGQYAYFITESYPFVPRCLNGATSSSTPAGPPPAGAPSVDGTIGGPPTGAPMSGGPDFTDAAKTLGVTIDELRAILPRPGEPLDDAAAALGVTVEELIAILPRPPG